MPTDPTFYPFANQPPSSNQNVFPYDIVINETFPGIIFDPREPGGVYSVIREVDGCLWFVNNADFNPNTLRWTQEDPTNPALPAYALELCANGTFNRYFGAATVIPGDPISWQLVFEIDAKGYVLSTPPTVTASGPGQNQLTVTWNAGSSTQVEARRIVVTDTSSASNSLLDNLVVNGNSKWAINKSGTLIAGSIPFARITGFSPVFNNATFTGTTEFLGPVDVDAGIDVAGGLTADTIDATTITAVTINTPGGGQFSDSPTETTAGITVPAPLSSVTIPIKSSHGYPVGTTVIVSGPGTVNPVTFSGWVTANNGTPATSITVEVASIVAGSVGNVVSSGAIVGYTTAFALGSSNGITISNIGSPVVPIPNISLLYNFPTNIIGSYTLPAPGSSVVLSVASTIMYATFAYVLISDTGGTHYWLGEITTINALPTSSITVKCQEIFSGTAGNTVSGGNIFFGSYLPSVAPVGGYISQTDINNGGGGPSTIVLALIGDSSFVWDVQVSSINPMTGAGSGNLTVTGGTFSGAPVNWSHSSGDHLHMFSLGQGNGGSSITANIPTVTGGSTSTLFFEIKAIRVA